MENKPYLSIIVPVYNVENYIHKTIKSLQEQTLSNIEIILVDDGSQDKCPIICDNYAQNDKRFKVIHKINEGLGLARNSGMQIANGEYVTFCDSDDYVDANCYEELFYLARKNDLDILRYSCNRFIKEDIFLSKSYNNKLVIYDKREVLRECALHTISGNLNKSPNLFLGRSCCMAIYKTAFLKRNNLSFKSERIFISEDSFFNYKCLLKANKVGYLPNTYYHYRINPSSLSRVPALDKLRRSESFCKFVEEEMRLDGFQSSEYYAQAYHIQALRVETLRILESKIPLNKKYHWFKEEMKSSYILRIKKTFPMHLIPLKYRIYSLLCFNKLFFLVLICTYLTKIINILKFASIKNVRIV